MPIWHIEKLKTPLAIVYIGLITNEANEMAPRSGPHPELPPLGDNLADTVADSRTASQATSVTTDTT